MAVTSLFLKGLAIGLVIAVPAGPVGLLCVHRTLLQGALVGLVSGLGAATADGVYGAVAALGLTGVAHFLLSYQDYLRLFGGAFLLVLGLRVLRRPPAAAAADSDGGLLHAFASCFVLALTNPATILAFVAIFAGIGVVGAGDGYGEVISLMAGVFLGSALWWLALSGLVTALRGHVTPRLMAWIHRASGAILVGFGGGVLASTVVWQ